MREKISDGLAYPPRGMEIERASAYVGLGRTKFLELVEAGRMPGPVDLDGSPRWDRHDVDRAFEDLKERKKDPVQRGREQLRERLRQQEQEPPK